MTEPLILDCAGQRYLGVVLAPGCIGWRAAGPQAGVLAILPAPVPSWPAAVVDAYGARVVADLTGRCPACASDELAVAPLAPGQASLTFHHRPACPAGLALRSWFLQP